MMTIDGFPIPVDVAGPDNGSVVVVLAAIVQFTLLVVVFAAIVRLQAVGVEAIRRRRPIWRGRRPRRTPLTRVPAALAD